MKQYSFLQESKGMFDILKLVNYGLYKNKNKALDMLGQLRIRVITRNFDNPAKLKMYKNMLKKIERAENLIKTNSLA